MDHENEVTAMRPLYALIAAFLLADVHQYLFYGQMAGVSIPTFVCLLYIFVLYVAKDRLRKNTWFSYVWLGAVFLLSLTYALFANWFFFGLNFLVIPALIFLHMTYMLSYRLPSWSGLALIGAATEHFFAQSLRHWPTVFKIIQKAGGRNLQGERKQVLVKVLIGLLISCPLLLIVISLLSSADGVFHEILADVPALLERISFSNGLARILWIILLGMGLFGFAQGFADPKHYDWSVPPLDGEPVREPFTFSIDPVIITTILVSINTVYVLFVSVQFSYLFGAWDGVLPEGSTYADYARSGFFELILVTAINFAILLLSLLSVGEVKKTLKKIINVLLYTLVLCSMVMLYSAYSRLALYEEAYGYTYIRFLVHAFMIFLSLLLVIAAVRISRVNFPLAKCYIVLGLLAYVLMNYIGMDGIIAGRNMERYEASGKLDAAYLSGLSWDAVPKLIEFSKKEDGLLDQNLRDKWQSNTIAEQEWPSFNISKYRAQQALEQYFAE